MTSRLGGRRLPTYQVWQARIQALQQRMTALAAENYEILHADESLFNIDHYVGSHWAPSGHPVQTESRYSFLPRVVICLVISAERGKVYTHYGVRSFTAQDIIEIL